MLLTTNRILSNKNLAIYTQWIPGIMIMSICIKKIYQTYPSITKLSYKAGLSQTGHVQVGFLSFICKKREASKHCRWLHVSDRHGRIIRIFPKGHKREHRSELVAISHSPSSRNFCLTENYFLSLMLCH